MLNGKVISDGHHNNWCRTTDNQRLAGKVVDGTHYHGQNPYAANQSAAGQGMPAQNMTGQYNQPTSGQSRLNGQMTEEELRSRKMIKTIKAVVIIFLVLWAAPFILGLLTWIFVLIYGK